MTGRTVIACGAGFLRIHVTDALTGSSLSGAALEIDIKSGAAEWAPVPFAVHAKGGGHFSVVASIQEVEARLRTAVSTKVRVTVTAIGYPIKSTILDITASNFTIIERDEETERAEESAGTSINQRVLRGAPFDIALALSPAPVRLAGYVIRDNDLSAPVPGATLTVDGGDVGTTDAAGRFILAKLPLSRTVEIAATKDLLSATFTHITDFSTPTNQLTLSLTTPPS